MRFPQALIITSFGFVLSGSVLALGLGKLEVKSSYGEPLNAQLELIEIGDLTENEIIAKFASSDDMNKLGSNQQIFYTRYNFDVTINPDQTGFIKITTDRPIKEPSIDLFVSLIWPSGKMVRKYEVTTELPAFVHKYQRRYDTLVAKQTQPPITQPLPQKIRHVSPPSYQPSSPDHYYVRENDTLMEIAAQMRPSTAVSLQQTMVAIYKQNLHAFINNNLNLLRKNVDIKIPSTNEISNIPYAEAITQISKHHNQWQNFQGTGTEVASTDSPPTTTKSNYIKPKSIKPKNKETDKARLKIVTQESKVSSQQESAKKTTAMSTVEFNKLQNQLTSDRSELAAISENNKKSFAKLKDLERRIQSLKRRIKDKDNRISQIQSELDESNQ